MLQSRPIFRQKSNSENLFLGEFSDLRTHTHKVRFLMDETVVLLLKKIT